MVLEINLTMFFFISDISAVSIVGEVKPGDQYVEFSDSSPGAVGQNTAMTLISHTAACTFT